jgi:cytochrome b involved in lipid metabolism
MKKFQKEEIIKHNKENDCWLIIDNKVYDVTSFLEDHPGIKKIKFKKGGKNILLKEGGKDVSEIFHSLHSKNVLPKFGKDLLLGDVAENIVSKTTLINQPKNHFGDVTPYCSFFNFRFG